MQKIGSLVDSLRKDFPEVKFKKSDDFRWDSNNQAIMYDGSREESALLTLHELAHAVLGHKSYSTDVELIRMEAEAWDHVRTSLSKRYSVVFDEEFAEEQTDTYRNWLYKRSRCPKCECVGFQQTDTNSYKCPMCGITWQVSAERQKRLYRKRKK